MPEMFASRRRPLLFAHRGASRQAPENTLEAFDLAVRLGADVLEMDVHLSADGEVRVMHDARLERTTNGTGLLREHTCAALQRLDAGAKFLTSDGEPRFRDRGLVIPRFE
ncbi:MAG TPA: glycerophosphodiester phosphodiesterase family protein, partial [Myxococcota bacterium]|nr:glycerophosphodiester phosphodiesterase family protein [Myxococcota bacterium]